MPCLIFVKLPLPDAKVYGVQLSHHRSTVNSLHCHLLNNGLLSMGLRDSIYMTKNGRSVSPEEYLSCGDSINVHLRLCGGKGGFGSMLRALGSQIEKTTNTEACRDLSGRRMRDVNNEKKMIEWAKKKAEQDKEKERQRIAKLERQLEKPKHFFNDPEYEKSLETTQDNVEHALKKGLEAHKRKCNHSTTRETGNEHCASKKSKLWFGLGANDDDDSDSSGLDDESEFYPMISGRRPLHTDGASSSAASNDSAQHSAQVDNHTHGNTGDDEDPVQPHKPSKGEVEDTEKAMEVTTGEQGEVGSQGRGELPDNESVNCKDSGLPQTNRQCVGVGAENESTETTVHGQDGQAEPKSECMITLHKDEQGCCDDLDLTHYKNAEQLESIGMERLKQALQTRGLKCGGTLIQRAQRLFSVKGLDQSQIPTNLLAAKPK